jgi:hypothetical protein
MKVEYYALLKCQRKTVKIKYRFDWQFSSRTKAPKCSQLKPYLIFAVLEISHDLTTRFKLFGEFVLH